MNSDTFEHYAPCGSCGTWHDTSQECVPCMLKPGPLTVEELRKRIAELKRKSADAKEKADA